MAHPGQSARKGNNYVPNDYRPFQCCPTKLERATRVPKMSAQKLSHKKDTNEKSRFEFEESSSGAGSKKPDAKSNKIKTEEQPPKFSTPSKKASTKRSNHNNNDDDDDIVVPTPIKETKKPTPTKATKDINKPKPGQKGLLGIAKIVNWF